MTVYFNCINFFLASENLAERTECGTPGCRGIGHVKGPKFATHNSASGCPYSQQNLHKIRLVSDRLNVKHEICDYDEDSLHTRKVEKTEKLKHERSEKSGKISPIHYKSLKSEKDIKQEDGEFSDRNERPETSERLVMKKKKKKLIHQLVKLFYHIYYHLKY